jgi:hypothetical protein
MSKCYLTNPEINQPKESTMKTFMLLNQVSAKDFFLTENEYKDVLKEHGIWSIDGFLCAHNLEALKFAAIEACIPGKIVEYTEIYPVNHEGYGEIYP